MRRILLMGRVVLFLMAYKKPKGFYILKQTCKKTKTLKIYNLCISFSVCVDVCVRMYTYIHPIKTCVSVYIHRPIQGLACVCLRDPEIAYWVQI